MNEQVSKAKLETLTKQFFETNDYFKELLILNQISTYCHILKVSPKKILAAQGDEAQALSSPTPSGSKCPYCNFVTEHGATGLKAHIGRKHPHQPIKF